MKYYSCDYNGKKVKCYSCDYSGLLILYQMIQSSM